MSISQARQDVVEAVEQANYRVHAYEAPKLVAPCVIVDEGEPFITEGDVMDASSMTIHFDLYLFQRNVQDRKATDAMDEMIERVIFNLGGWGITDVQGHLLQKVGDTTYLTSKISVQNNLEIGDL